MRKLSTIALVSCLTLGATAAMAAQTTPSTSTDKPATSGTMARTTKTAKTTTTTTTTKTKAGHTSGALTAMDATAKTITVKDTYTVTDATKFTAKGKAITMADLHVGDTVSVTYTKNGANWDATRVVVTKAAKM
jgi:hypothetical protein